MKNFTLAELTVDDQVQGEVPCVFLEVQQVNKDNVYDLVVKSGFQAYDDVYRDIPEAQRPRQTLINFNIVLFPGPQSFGDRETRKTSIMEADPL